MKTILRAHDKAFIKAYFHWCIKTNRGYPRDYECSLLIENVNYDHRQLVKNYLKRLIELDNRTV